MAACLQWPTAQMPPWARAPLEACVPGPHGAPELQAGEDKGLPERLGATNRMLPPNPCSQTTNQLSCKQGQGPNHSLS